MAAVMALAAALHFSFELSKKSGIMTFNFTRHYIVLRCCCRSCCCCCCLCLCLHCHCCKRRDIGSWAVHVVAIPFCWMNPIATPPLSIYFFMFLFCFSANVDVPAAALLTPHYPLVLILRQTMRWSIVACCSTLVGSSRSQVSTWRATVCCGAVYKVGADG